jgi:hypothetical protein
MHARKNKTPTAKGCAADSGGGERGGGGVRLALPGKDINFETALGEMPRGAKFARGRRVQKES